MLLAAGLLEGVGRQLITIDLARYAIGRRCSLSGWPISICRGSGAMAEYAAVDPRAPTGRRRTLVTPEGVDLQLKLGDIGQRIGAFMLDLIIMLGALVVLTIAAAIVIASLGAQGLQVGAVDRGCSASSCCAMAISS